MILDVSYPLPDGCLAHSDNSYGEHNYPYMVWRGVITVVLYKWAKDNSDNGYYGWVRKERETPVPDVGDTLGYFYFDNYWLAWACYCRFQRGGRIS